MFGKITKFHGSSLIEVEIITSELPATMPLVSDGIDNLGSGYTLAPGSTMIVTGADKEYILGDNGTWEELPAGGGDISGKADKVSGAVSGNLAGLDGGGNLTDSGKKAADFEISNAATGTSLTLTDATDGYLQGITIKGHSEVVSGVIKSVGDAGWGVVDLGTLTWIYDAENTYFISNIISNKPVIAGGGDNGLCSNYIVVTNFTVFNMPDKSILIGSGSSSSAYRVSVKDTSYTDATTFKTAMSGVILYYPLESATGASPTLGITAKDDTGHGTAATITTALPLRSVSDSVYDTLDNEKVVKKCAEVDLGNLTWYKSSAISNTFYINPSDFEPSSAGIPNGVLMGGNYTYVTYNDLPDNDKVYSTRINHDIYVLSIRDTSYSDVSTFKTAMSGVKLVYPLATPTTTSLTASERSALATLRTFDSTTHIDATDAPSMTVNYLKNTDNGKAASAIDQKIIVLDVPEMHRMIFRGKNLGEYATSAQENAVKNGSFDNLFIGDYWENQITINATIDGTVINNTFVVRWRVSDISFWLHCGDTAFEIPHLVIVPDICLYKAKMNDANTVEGGYVGSKMYTTNLTPAKTVINTVFSDLVLSHRDYLVNAVSNGKASGGAWLDSTVELMNEPMVYGHREFTPGCDGTTVPANHTIDKTQLALFALAPKFITNRANQWLRDVVSAASFASVDYGGATGYHYASSSCGVRPVFAIG